MMTGQDRTLQICIWNVQGIHKKLEEIIKELGRIGMGVIVVTETKKKGNEPFLYENNNF
jgi:hypothetical protein